MTMHTYSKWAGLALTAGMTVFGAEPSIDIRAALVPDANVIVFANASAVLGSGFAAKVAELSRSADVVSATAALTLDSGKLGITPGDVHALIASASLQGMQGNGSFEMNSANFAVGVRTLKPLSMASVKETMMSAAEEMQIEEHDFDGGQYAVFTNPATASRPQELSKIAIALTSGGKLLLAGSVRGVQGALQRLEDNVAADPSPAMQAARSKVQKGTHGFALFVPTAEIRKQMTQYSTQNGAGSNPMVATLLRSLSTMQSLAFAARVGDELNTSVVLSLVDAQTATNVKTIVDAAVLGMVKGLLMTTLGPESPMVQSMAATQQADAVTLQVTVTKQDLDMLKQATMRQLTGPTGETDAVPAPAAPAADEEFNFFAE